MAQVEMRCCFGHPVPYGQAFDWKSSWVRVNDVIQVRLVQPWSPHHDFLARLLSK